MSKWIVYYKFDSQTKWDVIEASNTMSAKEIMLNKHKSNAINILDIDAYEPKMIETTDEEIQNYRNRVISLI